MVCDLLIKQMEEKLGRKLTEEEKRKVREKAGHVEISKSEDFDDDQKSEISDIEDKEELEVCA